MIIVQFGGGLGNQIFQYAFGKKLAKERHTILASDIHWYKISKDRDFVLGKFQIKTLHLPRKAINFFASEYAKQWDKWLGPLGHHAYFEEDKDQIKPIPKGDRLYLRGYWNAHVYFEDIVDDIKKNIILKSKHQTKVYERVLSEIKDCNAVAIHIRRGDYAQNPEYIKYFGLVPSAYYDKALLWMNDKIDIPRFFVFTDDITWVRENLSLPECAVMVSDLVDGTDYLEFDLMRQCQHQIIANSTFSWWAARLNPHEQKIIIQPKQWYADKTAQSRYEAKQSFYMRGAIRL
jgi:hypothetical protein